MGPVIHVRSIHLAHFLVSMLAIGCATTPVAPSGDCTNDFGSRASLAIDKAGLRAKGASDKLIGKLESSAYRYFRALGPEFASRTCLAFRDDRWHLPMVAIHGDAHVEQFVVTAQTYGIEDFDQAGFGPALVDLVRYAASLHLVCKEAAWPCQASQAVDSYFHAYREALEKKPETSSPPSIVPRLRKRVAQDRRAWLAWADQQMTSVSGEEEATNRLKWGVFVSLMNDVKPDRDARFFDIVRIGALSMGIGSALEKKLLFRIRGATDAPDDDEILEARASRPPAPNGCSWRPPHGGALHALMFMSLLGPRMPDVFGFAPLSSDPGALEFWVQSWDPGYQELSRTDIQSQGELDELAAEAARQLAGHFWTRFPDQLRAHQRRAQLDAFDLTSARAMALAQALAQETLEGWERFKTSP